MYDDKNPMVMLRHIYPLLIQDFPGSQCLRCNCSYMRKMGTSWLMMGYYTVPWVCNFTFDIKLYSNKEDVFCKNYLKVIQRVI